MPDMCHDICEPGRYTGHAAGSAGIALSRATSAMKAALAFGIRCWVAKSTNTIPNRFW